MTYEDLVYLCLSTRGTPQSFQDIEAFIVQGRGKCTPRYLRRVLCALVSKASSNAPKGKSTSKGRVCLVCHEDGTEVYQLERPGTPDEAKTDAAGSEGAASNQSESESGSGSGFEGEGTNADDPPVLAEDDTASLIVQCAAIAAMTAVRSDRVVFMRACAAVIQAHAYVLHMLTCQDALPPAVAQRVYAAIARETFVNVDHKVLTREAHTCAWFRDDEVVDTVEGTRLAQHAVYAPSVGQLLVNLGMLQRALRVLHDNVSGLPVSLRAVLCHLDAIQVLDVDIDVMLSLPTLDTSTTSASDSSSGSASEDEPDSTKHEHETGTGTETETKTKMQAAMDGPSTDPLPELRAVWLAALIILQNGDV